MPVPSPPLLCLCPQVTPNDEVRGIVVSGADVLPNRVTQRAFKGMHGKTLNYVHFKEALNKLDQWYQDKGVLAQVGGQGVPGLGGAGAGGWTSGTRARGCWRRWVDQWYQGKGGWRRWMDKGYLGKGVGEGLCYLTLLCCLTLLCYLTLLCHLTLLYYLKTVLPHSTVLPLHPPLPPQVSDFNITDGLVHIECAEAKVGQIELVMIDPKTSQPNPSSRTRPEVVLRHLATTTGQAYNLKQVCACVCAGGGGVAVCVVAHGSVCGSVGGGRSCWC